MMNPRTAREFIDGPAGRIECAVDRPDGSSLGLAVVCHPHPQFGGTLDNKVVQTIARACLARSLPSVRFNFRGVGGSQGSWDEGRGEIDDALAVVRRWRAEAEGAERRFVLAGFSFGAYVAASAAAQLASDEKPHRLVLVAPSTLKQAVPDVAAGTLVVHGETDDVVPLSATLDWARPQGLPVVVLPGVGHFFHGQLGLLRGVVFRELHDLAEV